MVTSEILAMEFGEYLPSDEEYYDRIPMPFFLPKIKY